MAAEGAPLVLKHMAFELAVRFTEELAMELLVEQMVEKTMEQRIAAAADDGSYRRGLAGSLAGHSITF